MRGVRSRHAIPLSRLHFVCARPDARRRVAVGWSGETLQPSEPNDQLSVRLIRLHHPMSFLFLVKSKHACRFCLILPGSHAICDLLEGISDTGNSGVPNTKLPKKLK